jgi:hypothetical protein
MLPCLLTVAALALSPTASPEDAPRPPPVPEAATLVPPGVPGDAPRPPPVPASADAARTTPAPEEVLIVPLPVPALARPGPRRASVRRRPLPPTAGS